MFPHVSSLLSHSPLPHSLTHCTHTGHPHRLTIASSSSPGYSLSAPGPAGGGGEAMAAFAFQSLEGKIETMQQEHNEKLRALEAKKWEAAAMKEDLAIFTQGKHLLQRKAAALAIEHQQATLQLLETQVQVEAATQAIKDLQRLLAILEPYPHPTQRPGSKSGDSSDHTVAKDMLVALEEEATHWEAAGLERELQVRVLRRFNMLLEEETRKMRQALENKQEDMSKLVRENLHSEEPARMVAVHEAVVVHKRALQQLRGVNATLLSKVKEKQTRLEALKQKAQAMDASLREEEAAYMTAHSAERMASSCTSATPIQTPASVDEPSQPLPHPALQQARSSTEVEEENDRAGYGLSLACDA